MEGLKLKYFVLKPDGDDEYAKASRIAMEAYAYEIYPSNPELAKDLLDWINVPYSKTYIAYSIGDEITVDIFRGQYISPKINSYGPYTADNVTHAMEMAQSYFGGG